MNAVTREYTKLLKHTGLPYEFVNRSKHLEVRLAGSKIATVSKAGNHNGPRGISNFKSAIGRRLRTLNS